MSLRRGNLGPELERRGSVEWGGDRAALRGGETPSTCQGDQVRGLALDKWKGNEKQPSRLFFLWWYPGLVWPGQWGSG